MRFTAVACILFAAYFTTTVSAQTITGRVVDKKGKPISQATVKLKVKGASTVTDNNGVFTLKGVAIITSGSRNTSPQTLCLNGRNLIFTNEFPQLLTVEPFDLTGKRSSKVYSQSFGKGSYSLRISSLISRRNTEGLYIVRINKGAESILLPFNSLSATSSISSSAMPEEGAPDGRLAKRMATPDSLIVSKATYLPASVGLDSDADNDVGAITLKLENDPDDIIEKKIDSLLLLMSVDEKIAQTAEVLVDIISTDDLKNNMYGSVFNGGGCPFASNTKETWVANLDAMHDAAKQSKLGIPILYGIDAVHGNATIEGATVFPHNIGMGCTGDTALVAKMAHITATECRAVGINLNFGPAISVVRDERWGRSYEGYGETPEINSLMSAAYVRGLQGNGDLSRPDAVAACAKHFIGDGGTTGGINGGITELTDESMRAIHLPPYEAAVKEGVASIMPSYNAWSRNGQTVRCTNDKYSLTDLLKDELHWDGFCLSDWDAIPQTTNTGVLAYTTENVAACINAGIDMAMIAKVYEATDPVGMQGKVTDYKESFKQIASSTVPMTRLDDAVRRILRIKYRLNLFENAKSNPTLLAEFGSAEHRAVARECVQKSCVLLKNEASALPLKNTEKVVVVGPWANKLGAQCGGWTITWQGSVDHSTITGTTILKGLQEVGGANVMYDETGDNLGDADKIVLVVGEAPYAETVGDHGHANPTDGGYADCAQCNLYPNKAISINLSECPHADLIEKCAASTKPVILVLISGRPLIINSALEKSKAFVAAWLPGSEGGGVADLLYGTTKFTGKLTHTWPSSFEQIPINNGTPFIDEKKGAGGTPLFEYGFGLSF